jgi:hypothetical protein
MRVIALNIQILMLMQMQERVEDYIRDARLGLNLRTGARLKQDLNRWFGEKRTDTFDGKWLDV